jgi:hypothetical protein
MALQERTLSEVTNLKRERDFALANLAAVNRLISGLTDKDVLTRLSLEVRRDELKETLERLDECQKVE